MARTSLFEHRKFKRLSHAIGSRALAAGSLELIWNGCYTRADPYLGDEVEVEMAAEWQGEPGKLCAALAAAGGGGAGFIERDKDRDGWRVHDLFDHAPPNVKTRGYREIARRAAGKTLSDVRREAGQATLFQPDPESRVAEDDDQAGSTANDQDRPANDHADPATDRSRLGGVGLGKEGKGEDLAPAQAVASSRASKPKKAKSQTAPEPMPFTIAELLTALRETSGGWILTDPFVASYAKPITTVIRELHEGGATLADVRLAGEYAKVTVPRWPSGEPLALGWVATGGKLAQLIAKARAWKSKGSPAQQQPAASARPVGDAYKLSPAIAMAEEWERKNRPKLAVVNGGKREDDQ